MKRRVRLYDHRTTLASVPWSLVSKKTYRVCENKDGAFCQIEINAPMLPGWFVRYWQLEFRYRHGGEMFGLNHTVQPSVWAVPDHRKHALEDASITFAAAYVDKYWMGPHPSCLVGGCDWSAGHSISVSPYFSCIRHVRELHEAAFNILGHSAYGSMDIRVHRSVPVEISWEEDDASRQV